VGHVPPHEAVVAEKGVARPRRARRCCGIVKVTHAHVLPVGVEEGRGLVRHDHLCCVWRPHDHARPGQVLVQGGCRRASECGVGLGDRGALWLAERSAHVLLTQRTTHRHTQPHSHTITQTHNIT
jgi:hypothetical protein